MNKLISIVAPMYNEESLVREYCREAREMVQSLENRYDFEIILINDGSVDETYKIMLQEQATTPDIVSTICLTRNFGLEGAVNAGIRKAAGDAVVVMDADLQDPFSLIPKMIQKWENGADIVVASRASRGTDTIIKRATANAYYKILNTFSGKLKLEKSAANFRLLSRKALNQVLALPEVNSVFRVVVPFIGMKTDIVEYERDKRYAGKTKYNLKKMIPYALDSITGISVEPLRKIYYIHPFMCSFIIVSVIFSILLRNDWQRFWLILLFISIVAEIMFLAISVISEYIAQLMIEAKGRPSSIIYDYRPASVVKEHHLLEEQ